MKITTELSEITERYAVCKVCVENEGGIVTVYGSSLLGESNRYVELAQARALVLARQLLEEGLESVNPEAFLTGASSEVITPSLSTEAVPAPPVIESEPPPVVSPEPKPDLPPVAQSKVEEVEPETAAAAPENDEPLPDIPW